MLVPIVHAKYHADAQPVPCRVENLQRSVDFARVILVAQRQIVALVPKLTWLLFCDDQRALITNELSYGCRR